MGASFVLTAAVFSVRVGCLFEILVWLVAGLQCMPDFILYSVWFARHVTLRSCDSYGIGVKLLILLLGSC